MLKMSASARTLAVLAVSTLLLAGCKEDKSAPMLRHTGISDFERFINKTGSMKGMKTYPKSRNQIVADSGLGVIYEGARTEGEVFRFSDLKMAEEMLPALKAVRKRLGESENCERRGYFIACGEEKFVETFRKWE